MHFSATLQSAVLRSHVVCLSVRPSVTLVNCDHIGWNSSKIISLLVSLDVRSLQPQHDGSAPRRTPLNFGPKSPTPCWYEWDIRLQIAAEWLHIAQRSQWRAYRKLPSLFLMVPSMTPTTSPSPKIGASYAPNIREWPYLCNGWSDPLHVWF